MRSPNRPTEPAATWAPDHLGIFVEQVRDDRFLALWMLIATSGIRLEALTGLRRQDVDLDEGSIGPLAVTPSQGKAMTTRQNYLLDPAAYDVLREHVAAWAMERQALRQETQKLFVWSNGEQVDAGAVQTMFRQHCSMAGLPVVPLQTKRQAYVVAAIDSGVPVRHISDRLSEFVGPQTLSVPGGDEHVVRRQRAGESRRGDW